MCKCNKEKKSSEALKALFIIVGAVVTVGTVIMVLYSLFKKYFKITFECSNDDCDDYFDDEYEDYEPICCCEDDDEDSLDEETTE